MLAIAAAKVVIAVFTVMLARKVSAKSGIIERAVFEEIPWPRASVRRWHETRNSSYSLQLQLQLGRVQVASVHSTVDRRG